MRENFTTQLSDNGAAEQRQAGYLDHSDAIDQDRQAQERLLNWQRAAQAKNQLNLSMEKTAEYVKSKPLMSVGIAAGVGMMLSMMMRRKHK